MDRGLPKDRVIVAFSRIPEGVTVMVPEKVGLAKDDDATDVDEVIESFELELDVDNRAGGVGKGVDGMYPVELSVAGGGAVVYNIFDDMSPEAAATAMSGPSYRLRLSGKRKATCPP